MINKLIRSLKMRFFSHSGISVSSSAVTVQPLVITCYHKDICNTIPTAVHSDRIFVGKIGTREIIRNEWKRRVPPTNKMGRIKADKTTSSKHIRKLDYICIDRNNAVIP